MTEFFKKLSRFTLSQADIVDFDKSEIKKIADKAISDNQNQFVVILFNSSLLKEFSDYDNSFSVSDCNFKFGEITNGDTFYNSAVEKGSGIELTIKKNISIKKEILVLNILCGCSNQKNRIVFEENSAAEVFFEYISLKDNSILNSVTQIELNNNVNAGFHILEDAEHSNLINRFFYNVNKDCNLNTSTCAFNGNLIQNRSDINFLNTGSTAVSSGLVFAFENQNFNNLCFVNHKAAYCSLKQDYKTIADADGQSEFYGLVKVDHGAIKTDASQSNNNIMLSKNCKIESNPQLEIYADDVKCNHGSTTGMLNADAIYYMQTRGISRKTAETLLIKALTDQSAEMCNNMAYAQLLKQKIDDKLHRN